MFRKITLALTAALGAAALAPTSASAGPGLTMAPATGPGGPTGPVGGGGVGSGGLHGGHHHFGHHGGWGVGIAAGVLGGAILADSCYRKVVIDTPLGPRVRRVNVCE